MLVVVIYAGLYILLSIPAVQEKVKGVACVEASKLLGGRIDIGRLDIRPFSEVSLSDVSLTSPEGERCATIENVSAGIDIWSLLADHRIVLNYAEIIGLDASLSQPEKGGPLNIKFLIDALSPKDKNKKPAAFDLKFRNIVVRKSKAVFRRQWMRDEAGVASKWAEISLHDLRMDLSIPTLRNDLYRFAVRNLECDVTPGVSLRHLSADVTYVKDMHDGANDSLSVKGLEIELPHTSLSVGDVGFRLGRPLPLQVGVSGSVVPADFSDLSAALSVFDTDWSMGVDVTVDSSMIDLHRLRLSNEHLRSFVDAQASVADYNSRDSIEVSGLVLRSAFSPELIGHIAGTFPPKDKRLSNALLSAGKIEIDLKGNFSAAGHSDAQGEIITQCGAVKFDASSASLLSRHPSVKASVEAQDLDLGSLLSIPELGLTAFSVDADIRGLNANAEGEVNLVSDYIDICGNRLHDVDVFVRKSKNDISASLRAEDDPLSLLLQTDCHLAGKDSYVDADVQVDGLQASKFGVKGVFAGSVMNASAKVFAKGSNIDNVTGFLKLSDVSVEKPDSTGLFLSGLSLTVDSLPSTYGDHRIYPARKVSLRSDWVDADLSGDIFPASSVKEIKGIVASVFPVLLGTEANIPETSYAANDFTFDLNIKGESALYRFLNTPLRPLADIPVKGYFKAKERKAYIEFATPHLQQGKNKLIRDMSFKATLDGFLGMASVSTGATIPVKNGEMELKADFYGLRDKISANLGINPTSDNPMKGSVVLETSFSRIPSPLDAKGELAVHVDILPSVFTMNETMWNLAGGSIDYSGKKVTVGNFLVSHADQFVKIDGTASESADDVLKVRLNDIDLDYIFGMLNINYVSFGGMATGEVSGSRLLTKFPEAHTDFLNVRGLSYNGAVLGDAHLASDYNVAAQKVGIYGVIDDPLTRERRASIDGGIWVTRDSLSFDFDANKLNIELMKPFMSAFCSGLSGRGSGKCKLYGTFKDIDLIGDLRADTLSMKLDFTNTWYHAGNDSVFLRKGLIEVPPLRLYDDFGHTAEFSGWLKHNYFHEPVFNFRVRDARSLLCYDTNEKINPLWYGTIYGSGNVQINGRPGLIDIDMNMTTDYGSKFFYVISDTEEVEEYSFLSFTDRRKSQSQSEASDTIPEYLHRFMKEKKEMEELSSNVVLSLKGTVTNDALVTLVMDPKAGDNITARGQGALQMDYDMAANDLRMIGTYVLDEGNYNFTLQDIIIKNFNIRKGSLIKFDGDPMNANLDIAATYRVNTNLTDLDKSFSTDKDLNRTNVPVDALLMVKGPMTHPDITFDIELPSLTSDVERKVKSIVSTNDMMSRQIIYLLALNRFYTPEYTGGSKSSSGSEWSSMASSTISSQLSNILSQMTDKLDVAPSFRSEKGDFSDMEFDLALSSRLLNNRLLINGNFGYRDRSTSNTQFVGDFDIEYLLNRSGNLRLKAYNHFNDQNYYLRSALTTQGVGVVFRRDFDRLFGRRKKKSNDIESDDALERDTIGVEEKITKNE